MKKVITLLLLCITTAVYADSFTVIQDMSGNYVATAFTFGGAPVTVYNPNPQQ